MAIPDDELRGFLAGCAHTLVRLAEHGHERTQLAVVQWRDALLREPRHLEPLRLTRHGAKIYAQNDEDGIIAEILRRIGPGSRTFFEFGAGHGAENNTAALLVSGWTGLWVEPDPVQRDTIHRGAASWITEGRLRVSGAVLTTANVNEVARAGGVRSDLDVLSIDVDGNDIWLWRAFAVARPRVVVIEYNAAWAPPLDVAVPYADDRRWDGSSYFGASLAALARVGDGLGYVLVGCSLSGVNAFFVRADLATPALFHAPFTAAEHHEPPRYALRWLPSGHRPGLGRLVRP